MKQLRDLEAYRAHILDEEHQQVNMTYLSVSFISLQLIYHIIYHLFKLHNNKSFLRMEQLFFILKCMYIIISSKFQYINVLIKMHFSIGLSLIL